MVLTTFPYATFVELKRVNVDDFERVFCDGNLYFSNLIVDLWVLGRPKVDFNMFQLILDG